MIARGAGPAASGATAASQPSIWAVSAAGLDEYQLPACEAQRQRPPPPAPPPPADMAVCLRQEWGGVAGALGLSSPLSCAAARRHLAPRREEGSTAAPALLCRSVVGLKLSQVSPHRPFRDSDPSESAAKLL